MKNKSFKFNSIGIFGFGNMGQAIFKILQKEKKFNFFINDLRKIQISKAKFVNSLKELLNNSDLVFICVKPQNFKELESVEVQGKIIISIMAGITLKKLNQKFKGAKIIRTMPNLALQIGESVLGCYYQKDKFQNQELLEIEEIFSLFGEYILVKNENMLNNITAISGSGPAYVFSFINALIKSAMNLGFSKGDAKLIVDATVSGSFNYYQNQSLNLEKLIKLVSSKGGTTEAALQELDLKKYYNIWKRVTKKAQERAKKLSK